MTIHNRVITTTLLLSAGIVLFVAVPRGHAHYRVSLARTASRSVTIRAFEYALQKSVAESFTRFAPPGVLQMSYFTKLDEFGSDSIPPPPATKASLVTPLPQVGRSTSQSKFDAARYKLPTGLQILQTIDSTGSRVRVQERIDSITIGVPKSISLDQYLAERRENISKKVWDSLITVYDLKKAMSGDQLSKLLSQATNVAIPLPPNPLTSIFGKPEISINVNGEVNVRGGWRWDSQNLGASSAFGQSQSSPIFTQDIQINVSGRIGDKLRLGTDWSTRRQFEFDNRFRIGYDGYDDDIIKKVELGNVQMQNNSAFISSSQALFGVRADFQFGPLFLKSIASQRRGERRFVNVNGGSSRTRFVLRGYDYAQNHFFLDTVYKPLYRNYWRNTVPVVTIVPSLVIKGLEVYESSGDVQDQAVGGVEVIAYAELNPIRRGLREFYPAALKAPDVKIEAGKVERGRFLRLPESRFTFDANLGTISILNMRRDRTYAVAYRTEGASNSVDDDLYTGTMTEGGAKDKDTLILKLMYRPNLQPGFRSLWARQMRNIYFINATNVNPTDARINVFYLRTNNDSTDVLEGASEKIVTALGVDRVNNGSGQTPPDGVFDFIGAAGAPTNNPNPGGGNQGTVSANAGTGPNLAGGSPYFNPQRGEITFPSLEPFREGLDTAFARRGNIGAARQFYFSSIYDNQVELARQQTAQDRWLIVGEVQGQLQGRIPLGFNIAPGSVRV
ncbi:MAG: hypothetical protein JNL32_12805, partial [Candidatus Kapabacteria bacterium]|nr:hypothetical protein [Candidatus Kapabacteria bacterium]